MGNSLVHTWSGRCQLEVLFTRTVLDPFTSRGSCMFRSHVQLLYGIEDESYCEFIDHYSGINISTFTTVIVC